MNKYLENLEKTKEDLSKIEIEIGELKKQREFMLDSIELKTSNKLGHESQLQDLKITNAYFKRSKERKKGNIKKDLIELLMNYITVGLKKNRINGINLCLVL